MGPGGDYRQALTALTLAAGGNVTGGAGEFVQAAAVNYLQGLGAAKIKEISPMLEGESAPGQVALHALLGCAGAAAKGQVAEEERLELRRVSSLVNCWIRRLGSRLASLMQWSGKRESTW